MRTQAPSLSRGLPIEPRTSVGVTRYEGKLCVSFNYSDGGRAEILSIAEAEALAERLCDWIEVIRAEQVFGK